MTLTEFLLARIAEDEEMARAAGGMEWRAGCPDIDWAKEEVDANAWRSLDDYQGVHDADRTGYIVVTDDGGASAEQCAHIARHDPARVLAECEAKRRIVELHPSLRQDPEWKALGQLPSCAECGGERGQRRWPCGTLRAVAAVYADHEDWRPEWAV